MNATPKAVAQRAHPEPRECATETARQEEAGLAVFALDYPGDRPQATAAVKEIIAALGFEILLEEFVPATKPAASRPQLCPQVSGDELDRPSLMLVCLDVFPMPVADRLRSRYPLLDNLRIVKAELYADRISRRHSPAPGPGLRLRSTLNTGDAWAVLAASWPGEIVRFRAVIETRMSALRSEHVVIRDLSRWGHRSRVELIEHDGQLAVKKTFRHQALVQMEREIAFLDEIAPQRADVIPLIGRGANYFLTPYVKSRPIQRTAFGIRVPRLMKLRHVRQVADLMKYLFARGFDPIDFVPHNLLIGKSGALKAIDFEYAHRAPHPIDPERSACLAGVGDDFAGDWPRTAMWARDEPYKNRWYAFTGLPLRSFLYDSPRRQRLKRSLFYPKFIATKLVNRAAGIFTAK